MTIDAFDHSSTGMKQGGGVNMYDMNKGIYKVAGELM